MNLIPCSENCAFQNDGLCSLESTSGTVNPQSNACIHYLPRPAAVRNAQWHEVPPRYFAPESPSDP